jgi:hypothetical protein
MNSEKLLFDEKIGGKMAFSTLNKAKLCKNLTIILVSEESANFFAENWRKWQKIVIITSTPSNGMISEIFFDEKNCHRNSRNEVLGSRCGSAVE